MLQISDICELLNTELLGVVLEDEHIIISQNHGESMMGKKGTSQTCYENICRRLVGKRFQSRIFFRKNTVSADSSGTSLQSRPSIHS